MILAQLKSRLSISRFLIKMFKMTKKSQAATELALVFVFAFFFFSVFVISIYDRFYGVQRGATVEALKDMVNYLDDEITFAITSSPGYKRSFTLPFELQGLEYEVELKTASENISIISVYFPQSDISPATAAFYYNVTGKIEPGINFIYKEDGYINISQEG